jgi:hypothetical protein
MPEGGSAETIAEPALVTAMTLDIAMDDFNDARRAALTLQLAAQYGVHPSLITLQATPGSLRLTITIATTNGTDAPLNVVTLRDRVTAIDSAAFSDAVRHAMDANITITNLQPPEDTTVAVTRAVSCQKGQWHVAEEVEPVVVLGCSSAHSLIRRCSAGLIIDCTFGFYNPHEVSTSAAACVRCPENSNTRFERSTSLSDCLCGEGYYDSNTSNSAVECVECPVGTECPTGSTLVELPLSKGYYRLDTASVDVRECPDAQINCTTTFGSSECESASGCRGGTGNPCANNLTGVYCLLCNRSNVDSPVYYKRSTSDEVAKCENCGNAATKTVLVWLGILLAAFLAPFVVLRLKQRVSHTRLFKLVKRVVARYTPQNKFKIVFIFQIVSQVPSVYEISMPSPVDFYLESISTVVTLGLTSVATMPLECVGLAGYQPRLILWMIVPIMLVLVVAGIMLSSASLFRATQGVKREASRFLGRISNSRFSGRRLSSNRDSSSGRRLSSNPDNSSGRRLSSLSESSISNLPEPSVTTDAAKAPMRNSNTFERTLELSLVIMFVLYPKVRAAVQ